MIKSFWDKRTKDIFDGNEIKNLNNNLQNKARRKLILLNSAENLLAIKVFRSNRLEKKEGKIRGMKGYPNKWFSIWVDGANRIIFTWHENNAHNVLFHDYHK